MEIHGSTYSGTRLNNDIIMMTPAGDLHHESLNHTRLVMFKEQLVYMVRPRLGL